MKYNYSSNVVSDRTKSMMKEKNDCVVRAVAAAVGCVYSTAHQFCKDVYRRQDNKGVRNMVGLTKDIENKELQLDGINFKCKLMDEDVLTNKYKVNGDVIARRKTVKSFIKDFSKGTYIVLVSGHALCVKDGVMIDNIGEEWRPTRKVEDAIEVEIIDPQLEFQF
jgi:hypothetical protein